MTPGKSVRVVTGARLHFGLICGTNDTGWEFGGVGLMVRSPGWSLSLAATDDPPHVDGVADSTANRIRSTINRCAELLDLKKSRFDVRVVQQMPLHAGYGAGTQLTLAMAAALSTLIERKAPEDLITLSRLLGRAGRSAIGTAGFLQGGLLVDRGRGHTDFDPQRVLRSRIPEEWRFVLLRPGKSAGLCGDEERAFFDQQRTMSGNDVQSLASLIDTKLMPAVQDADFATFATALADYGSIVGRFYAVQQGDVFSNPLMQGVAQALTASGFPGAAQSSWGPGICVPAACTADAQKIVDRVRSFREDAAIAVQISEPLNCGATIRTTVPEHAADRRTV